MRTSGKFSWGILLCKYHDQPQEQRPPDFFRQFVAGIAEGSLRDYWSAMSYGALDMSDATVYGWITLPITLSDAQKLDRWHKTQACIDAVVSSPLPFFGDEVAASIGDEVAAWQLKWGTHDGLIVIVNADVPNGDSGKNGTNRIFWEPSAWGLTFLAHESGHVLGLDHSFDTNPAPWDLTSENRPGAYGDSRDIMSALRFANLPATFSSRFGDSGPGVNALTRRDMGWLPADRVWNVSHNAAEQPWSTQVELAAIDSPEMAPNLMLQIDASGEYDGKPVTEFKYTVEFRPKSGWDAGIAQDAVVIHVIRPGDHPRILWSANNTQDWRPGERFMDIARTLAIDIVFFDPARTLASAYVQAGPAAVRSNISVRRSLAHKFDLSQGLRSIKPSPPFRSDSVRSRLLENPPQFAPKIG